MSVWRKGMVLAERVYAITEQLPRKEDFGLTSQLRRAALSVPGNIAEGFGRHHTKDKLNFYYPSRGSLAETKSHLVYGERVGYFKQVDCVDLHATVDDIWRELNSLMTSLKRKPQPHPQR